MMLQLHVPEGVDVATMNENELEKVLPEDLELEVLTPDAGRLGVYGSVNNVIVARAKKKEKEEEE